MADGCNRDLPSVWDVDIHDVDLQGLLEGIRAIRSGWLDASEPAQNAPIFPAARVESVWQELNRLGLDPPPLKAFPVSDVSFYGAVNAYRRARDNRRAIADEATWRPKVLATYNTFHESLGLAEQVVKGAIRAGLNAAESSEAVASDEAGSLLQETKTLGNSTSEKAGNDVRYSDEAVWPALPEDVTDSERSYIIAARKAWEGEPDRWYSLQDICDLVDDGEVETLKKSSIKLQRLGLLVKRQSGRGFQPAREMHQNGT